MSGKITSFNTMDSKDAPQEPGGKYSANKLKPSGPRALTHSELEKAAQSSGGIYFDNKALVERMFKIATKVTKKSAAQGNREALFDLGSLYLNGYGVKLNPKKALTYFTHAAELGFTHAAELGEPKALNQLGVCYQNGIGTQPNIDKAVFYYELAAEQDDPAANHNLGLCYYNGTGVNVDLHKAEYYFQIAIRLGYSDAKLPLSDCYADLGYKYYPEYSPIRDLSEAARYYKLSADLGNPGGQHEIGRCFYLGEGVEKDLKKAQHYFELAAAQGHQSAINLLFFMPKSE